MMLKMRAMAYTMISNSLVVQTQAFRPDEARFDEVEN